MTVLKGGVEKTILGGGMSRISRVGSGRRSWGRYSQISMVGSRRRSWGRYVTYFKGRVEKTIPEG